MSRRSLRLANKAVKTVLEDGTTELKYLSTVNDAKLETKKRRTDFEETTSGNRHRHENVSSHEKGACFPIKLEKDDWSVNSEHSSNTYHVKSEDPTLSSPSNIAKEEKYIGAHVSISGGLHLAVERAIEIGAKSFAMFLRSQRQWVAKPLEQEDADLFRATCHKHNFSPAVILAHGIYLMNCGSPDSETLAKSRQVLVDELKRCEMLGLLLYNFHPGSTCGKIAVPECLDLIAESINLAHQKTKYVITVLENMACQGNTIGGKFEELRGIIDRVHDKSRMGVCLDTCHAFAAGFDLKTAKGFEKMMNDFENIIGLQYLRGVHLNDSKGELGCHLDRHENIGKGKIGKTGFHYFMNDARFNGIPIVLETPCTSNHTYPNEIAMLYSMQK